MRSFFSSLLHLLAQYFDVTGSIPLMTRESVRCPNPRLEMPTLDRLLARSKQSAFIWDWTHRPSIQPCIITNIWPLSDQLARFFQINLTCLGAPVSDQNVYDGYWITSIGPGTKFAPNKLIVKDRKQTTLVQGDSKLCRCTNTLDFMRTVPLSIALLLEARAVKRRLTSFLTLATIW